MRAARTLGISQSAVSRRLAQLEERLGFGLFVRSGGRLIPTVQALSIGEQLAPVFSTLDRIANHADVPRRSHDGTLRIVAPPTIAHRFLPGPVAAFARRNPDLHVVLEVIASDSLVTGVAECRFDVGLTDVDPKHDGIDAIPLLSTCAICLLPEGHRLADRDDIRPNDLEGEAFIALSRRHSSRAAIDRVFDRASVTRRTVIEAATNVSAMEFVREGMGVALINPFPIAYRIGEGIITRRFLPEIGYTTNFLVPANRPPTAVTSDFVEAVRAGIERASYDVGD